MTAVGDVVTIGAGVHGDFEARVTAVRSEDDFDVAPLDPRVRIHADGLRVEVTAKQ
jgi:transcription antitermination factor NusG